MKLLDLNIQVDTNIELDARWEEELSDQFFKELEEFIAKMNGMYPLFDWRIEL